MRFEPIMDKDEAKKYIEEMAEKLEVDLIDFGIREKTSDEIKIESDFLESVMAGLVFYDEDKKCMVQKLTRTITAGDFSRDALYYKQKYKVKDLRRHKEGGIEASLTMLSKICDVPVAILNELHGRNLEIAMACIDFFLK